MPMNYDDDVDYDDDDDYSQRRQERSRRRRRVTTRTRRDDDVDDIMTAADQLEDDGLWDDDDDDDDDFDGTSDLFSDALIPNALLDSMDPDGAAERFPELARDWKFWVDILLVLTLLDFLSAIGTGDPFLQDFLVDLSQATLPPPIIP
jgi:hypothetical protein